MKVILVLLLIVSIGVASCGPSIADDNHYHSQPVIVNHNYAREAPRRVVVEHRYYRPAERRIIIQKTYNQPKRSLDLSKTSSSGRKR